MPDETPGAVVAPAPLTTSIADSIPPEQAAALSALRTRLGLDSASAGPLDATVETPAAVVSAASPAAPNTPPLTEESVLRALAEEQLRLARERRQLITDRKADSVALSASATRLKRLDAIEAAQKNGDRIALLRALHNGELPDGELGEWGKEVGAAMSGDIAITPEDLDKIVERKLAAREEAASAALTADAAARAAVRTEANGNYLNALQGALTTNASQYPGITRFGVKAERVMQLVEESYAASGSKEVISVQDMLERLESDIKADIAATPYGRPPASSPTPPGAPQPAVSATPTTATANEPLTMDQIEARARAEIIKRARELMAARG